MLLFASQTKPFFLSDDEIKNHCTLNIIRYKYQSLEIEAIIQLIGKWESDNVVWCHTLWRPDVTYVFVYIVSLVQQWSGWSTGYMFWVDGQRFGVRLWSGVKRQRGIGPRHEIMWHLFSTDYSHTDSLEYRLRTTINVRVCVVQVDWPKYIGL